MSKSAPEKPFYIGWQEQMPEDQKKTLRRFLIPIFLLIPIIAIAIVLFQKSFNDHTFELGTLTIVEGVYQAEPVPILVADEGQLPEGTSRNILLVGYGKFGAESIMETIAARQGDLEGKKLSLEGTLIYGDGKTVMELTKKQDAFVQLGATVAQPRVKYEYANDQTLWGEILDPKCYFGVMKPGEGKIHKSCAIRCISGGIPPVFRTLVRRAPDLYEYYILRGKDNQSINQEVLPYVAEQIKLTGTIQTHADDWKVIYLDPMDISLLAQE
ncbi:MAG: hypothetical protein AAF242_01025 [Bacteroidota bacterium]